MEFTLGLLVGFSCGCLVFGSMGLILWRSCNSQLTEAEKLITLLENEIADLHQRLLILRDQAKPARGPKFRTMWD